MQYVGREMYLYIQSVHDQTCSKKAGKQVNLSISTSSGTGCTISSRGAAGCIAARFCFCFDGFGALLGSWPLREQCSLRACMTCKESQQDHTKLTWALASDDACLLCAKANQEPGGHDMRGKDTSRELMELMPHCEGSLSLSRSCCLPFHDEKSVEQSQLFLVFAQEALPCVTCTTSAHYSHDKPLLSTNGCLVGTG